MDELTIIKGFEYSRSGNPNRNNFEEAIAGTYPVILSIKNRLYQQGAVYASMTGSGSTVYGIFPGGKEIELDFPEEYWVKKV